MAITAANLKTLASQTDATSYTIASFTLTANRLALLAMSIDKASTPDEPSSIGGTLTATWVKVATVLSNSIATPLRRLSVYRTMVASDQTGTVVVDFGANTQIGFTGSVDEFAGVDTSGTNGSGAVVQSNTNVTDSNTALTVSLAAFANASNASYGAFARPSNTAITNGLTTELADLGHASPNDRLETQWQVGDVDPSASVGSNDALVGIGVEIAIAPAAAGWGPLLSDGRDRLVVGAG
jgi:hypothetical protein